MQILYVMQWMYSTEGRVTEPLLAVVLQVRLCLFHGACSMAPCSAGPCRRRASIGVLDMGEHLGMKCMGMHWRAQQQQQPTARAARRQAGIRCVFSGSQALRCTADKIQAAFLTSDPCSHRGAASPEACKQRLYRGPNQRQTDLEPRCKGGCWDGWGNDGTPFPIPR